MPFLTPDLATPPTTSICRRLVIPQDDIIIGAVNGALLELCRVENWQQLGAMSPDTIAGLMETMWLDYLTSEAICMIGIVVPFATDAPPSGILLCDGSTYDRADYPKLYAALGSPYVLDADTFYVPDLRGRFILAAGDGDDLTPRASGDTGGEEAHVLTEAEIAAHTHTNDPHRHPLFQTNIYNGIIVPGSVDIAVGQSAVAVENTDFASITIDATGGDEAHENMPPFFALKYGIVAR